MAKSQEEKDALKAAKAAAKISGTVFTMTTAGNKKFKVVAPDDSLDKDGDAESALEGEYRKG